MSLLTIEQQFQLVAQGLAKAKYVGDYVTFKYAKKVMYDYLWDQHPEVHECRGHTYHVPTGKLVLAAPRKSFNYLENGTWKDVSLDTTVYAYKKFNGFMATLGIHNGEILVGTTGSLDSDYAKLARQRLSEAYDFERVSTWCENVTWLFEICDPSDPHIVNDESLGAVYLGFRDNETGEFWPFAATPSRYGITLGELFQELPEVRHEGFMVYDEQGNVCKLKSPYYVGKKKLMRAKLKWLDKLWNNNFDDLPDQWVLPAKFLVNNYCKAEFAIHPDQSRRELLENIWEITHA